MSKQKKITEEKPHLKDHLFAELTSELKKVAIEYHDYGSLRIRIADTLAKYIDVGSGEK